MKTVKSQENAYRYGASLIIAVAAILLTGCFGGERQAYPGPALTKQETVTPKTPTWRSYGAPGGQWDLWLYTIDGKNVHRRPIGGKVRRFPFVFRGNWACRLKT